MQYCIGIGNTIMNIGSSFLLIPIVNTFMKQNGGGATAAVPQHGRQTYILGTARHKKGTPRKKFDISGMVVNFFAKFTVLTEEDSDHIFCKIHRNIWLHSKIIAI